MKNWDKFNNIILDLLQKKSQSELFQFNCKNIKKLKKSRSKLFDWFIEIAHSFSFSNETLIRSFKIFDQLYLKDKIPIKQKELHSFGVSCFLIATKLHEKKQLSIKQAIKHLSFG